MSCSSSFVLPSHTHAKQNTLTWSLVHLHPACLHFSFCLLTARSSIRFFHPAARARLFAPSASCGLRAVWRNVLQFLTPKKRICCAHDRAVIYALLVVLEHPGSRPSQDWCFSILRTWFLCIYIAWTSAALKIVARGSSCPWNALAAHAASLTTAKS